MKVIITARDLEILRKAVYGLDSDQIANDLMISSKEVEISLKVVLKSTQCKDPLNAMQALAKNGFIVSDQH
jgi:DNA-binding NarL/FixJ family response regulator